MSFMHSEITELTTWVEIDGTHGITAIPLDLLNMDQVNAVTETKYDVSEATLNEELGEYYEGRIQSVSLRRGYGARLSAPGYMDCTEWSVYDSENEARAELAEMYGDDEESEDDDDEL